MTIRVQIARSEVLPFEKVRARARQAIAAAASVGFLSR